MHSFVNHEFAKNRKKLPNRELFYFSKRYFQLNIFCEENFEGRRGVARNTADGIVTYSEASIGATTKHTPKLFHKISTYSYQAPLEH